MFSTMWKQSGFNWNSIMIHHLLIVALLCIDLVLSVSNLRLPEKEITNQIRALRKELFQNRGYDPMARPVRNHTHPTNVTIGVTLTYIKRLNLQENVLDTEGFVLLTWTDQHLNWIPSDFGGISKIPVHLEEVYRPDISMYNSVGSETLVSTATHSSLILEHTGKIYWGPQVPMRTICVADLTNWPADRQTCAFMFAPGLLDAGDVVLLNDSSQIDIHELAINPEWKIIRSACVPALFHFVEEELAFSEMRYELTIERQTSLYQQTVHFPILCALVVNLFSLLLSTPAHCAAKLGLSGLSLMMLLLEGLYLGFKLGFSSWGTPKIVIYLSRMMILVTCTIIWHILATFLTTARLALPTTVMQPIQRFSSMLSLPNLHQAHDIEAVQLTSDEGNEDNQPNMIEEMTRSSSVPKKLPTSVPNDPIGSSWITLIQLVDKLWFILSLILIVILHN